MIPARHCRIRDPFLILRPKKVNVTHNRRRFPMVGPTLSHYKIREKLGSGGMGDVYVAEDTTLRREVALKVLPPEMAESPERCKLFEREARAAAALNHPNIVTIHSVERAEGVHFITMELVRGKTLYDIIRSAGPLPSRDILNIAVQVAEGLAEAHSRNIIHRDLKPQNVMVTDEGRAKILDFGLAKALYPSQQGLLVTSEAETISAGLRREGKVVGTVAYMSPEQTLGKEVDSRSDVFSFGTMLYEMASGRRPFKGDTVTSTIAKILETEPEPLGELRPDVPFDLVRIVRRCLHKDPDERYNDTRDLMVDLKDLQQEITSGAVSRPSGAIAEGKVAAQPWIVPGKQERRKLAFGALGILALSAIVAIAYLLVGRQPPKTIAPPQPIHKQITFTGAAFYPAISPDGEFIAYVTGERGEQRAIVQDITGGGAIDVFSAEILGFLRWSPDGTALLATAITDYGPELLIVPRLGGTVRRLPGRLSYACWSPDGSQLAALHQPTKKIFLVDKSTGETKSFPLRGPYTFLLDIDWSPVSNFLVLAGIDNQERHFISTIRTDGSQEYEVLEELDEWVFSPRWSPKGDAIYYLRTKEQATELWKMPMSPDTGKPIGDPSLLIAGIQMGLNFTLSEDGKLLYTQEHGSSNLWLVRVDGSGEDQTLKMQKLTTGTLWNGFPSISPDGERVAFARGHGSTSNIFIMPLAGGSPQQITFLNSVNGSPAWSPDGKEIAFGSSEGGDAKVWRVSSEGGTPRPFVRSELSGTMDVSWGPTGILYLRPGNRNFHILDPSTEEERPLVEDDSVGWMFTPSYSPDGKKVAVSWNRRPDGLWLISLEDSSQVLLYEGGVRPVGWSPDGNWIYAWHEEDRKIVIVPVSGGDAKSLGESSFEGTVVDYSMTPDGKRFVFAVSETQSDVWLVENFDPDVH
jgi:Tol biopolymer transport system component